MIHGVKVLDLTIHLSGPYCTWLLACLGAEVTKVERPGEGDPARTTGPHIDGESVYFNSVNRGKRSIALDLKDDADRTVLLALAARSDVLVENFRPGVMERLGLGSEALAAVNPALIYASVSGYGHSGPLSRLPAYDVIVQAFSGMMSVTGPDGGPPVRVGCSVGDLAAGVFAALDIVAALYRRERGGGARRIDVSMADCQLALLENAVARTLNTEQVPGPIGTRHPSVTPFQAFETLDAMIVVAVPGDAEWARLCQALDDPALAADPRYASAAGRHTHQPALSARLAQRFGEHDAAHWLARLAEHDVPSGPVNDVRTAVLSPQAQARRMTASSAPPGRPAMRFVACPVGDRASPDVPAPRLDEHRDAILRGLSS